MDMLFNLSLYPVNALSFTHEMGKAKTIRADRSKSNDTMPIPSMGQSKTATDALVDRRIYYQPQKKFKL